MDTLIMVADDGLNTDGSPIVCPICERLPGVMHFCPNDCKDT